MMNGVLIDPDGNVTKNPFSTVPRSWIESPKHPSGGNFIDLSVFEDDGKTKSADCTVHGEADMVNSCKSLKRLTVALKYYETLRFISRREGTYALSIFTNFIETVYVQYIDDLAHFKRDHFCDLAIIHRNLKENEGFHDCNGSRCCGLTISQNPIKCTKVPSKAAGKVPSSKSSKTKLPSSSSKSAKSRSKATSDSNSTSKSKAKKTQSAESSTKSTSRETLINLISTTFDSLHRYWVHPFGQRINNSKVLVDDEPSTLHQMVGEQIDCTLFESKLLYRGTEDGFGYDDFWGRVEKHKRCLVVIETTESRVFGGFTKVGFEQHLNPSNSTWKSGPTGQGAVSDKAAFIYSLRTKDTEEYPPKCFPVERSERGSAIGYCFGALCLFGGTMGRGIYVDKECNLSTSTNRAYGRGFKGGKGYLDEGYGKNFVVRELEVFQLIVPDEK